ncbi:MAG TPA: DUF4157 domain-containing protein [Kofleriaceae bacterium]|nr:DUF4157 domain-containing protein [Kofleriaceae bacterium]
MTLSRESGARANEDTSSSAAAIDPGKHSRSGAIALQRKASSSVAAPATADVEPSPPPGDDPFGLHLQQPIQRQAGGDFAGGAPSPTGAGNPLPSGVQRKMESSFGADFSDVRVHQGPQASQVGAVAYAQGSDLHFAPGQYNPGTSSGDALIGHELAHVVQQRAGRVSTPQGKGAPVVDDHGLEAEADRAGDLAARGEPAGISGGGASGGGAIQRKEGEAPAPAAVPEQGADTFGLKGYLEQLKAKTGVSGGMGKYAEAKLGVTSPPIPQLGGGALKIEGEGRYMTSSEGNELEVSLHVGVTWGIDLKLFKADVQVFGEGKIKLSAKDGQMLECLGAAVKGVLFDALKMMNVRNCASLASPLAARATEWAVGSEVFDYDVFTALNWLAASPKVPAWVQDPAKTTVAALKEFFGAHKGGFEVSIAVGVSGDAGGGANGQGLQGGASAKAIHGIASEAGEEVSGEKRRNEFAIEAHLKKGETEGKLGYTFGGGRDIISVEAAYATENTFDFDKAKIISVGGILKLIAALGLGTSIGKAVTAPDGATLVNAIVSGIASGAGVIGNEDLKVLKKQYKLSLEIEREGDKPWKDAKVDCKLFLGNTVGGEADAGKIGKVEASAGAGTFISITREVKEALPGAG